MPTYSFTCPQCQEPFDIFRKMTDSSDVICKKCNSLCKRIFNSVTVLFKGEGFPDADQKRMNRLQEESSKPRDSRSSASEKVTEVYEEKLKAKDEKLGK